MGLVGLTPVASLEGALELIVSATAFVPGTYQFMVERTSSRGALLGATGCSPMSGPFGSLQRKI